MRVLFSFVFFLVVAFFLNTAIAASLSLTSIGALNTEGQQYTEWWYTGVRPLLQGTAEPGKAVLIRHPQGEINASASAESFWSTSLPLDKGDYGITISSEGQTYTFTLHLGSNMPVASESSTSAPAVPATGFDQVAMTSLGLGIITLALYIYISNDENKRRFERTFLSED